MTYETARAAGGPSPTGVDGRGDVGTGRRGALPRVAGHDNKGDIWIST